MSSSSTTPEDNERNPLKGEMDNKGFDDSKTNSQADLEPNSGETSQTEQQGPGENNQSNNEGNEEQELLKYGAKHVIMLFVPVSVCMALVVSIMCTIPFYTAKGIYFAYTPFEQEDDLSTSTKIWQSVANTLIVLVVVVILTSFLFLLYKHRCYKFIYGWLFLSSLMLLFFFIFIFLNQVFIAFDVVIDYFTMAFMLWNFGVVGMINIHWKGPLLLQQVYLLVVSALMAVTFIKHLPDWTTWVLLAGISVWDLIAVLSPKGPLQSLVKLAQERNEPIFPALIYSTTMVWKVEEGGVEGSEMDEVDGEVGVAGDSDVGDGGDGGDVGGSESEKTDDRKREDDKVVEEISVVGMSSGGKDNKGKGDGGKGEDGLKSDNGGKGENEAVGGGEKSGDGGMDDGEDTKAQEPPILVAAEVRVVNENNSNDATAEATKKKSHKRMPSEDEDSGVKLGLGDFIFYSILVGKASTTGDWNTTIACFVAILIGLCSTLLLLAIFKKALPALPISVAFGLIFYFATSQLVRPFLTILTAEQIFI